MIFEIFAGVFLCTKSVTFDVIFVTENRSISRFVGPPRRSQNRGSATPRKMIPEVRFSLFELADPDFLKNHVIFQKNGSRTPDFEFSARKSLIFGPEISKSGVPGEKVARFSEDKLGRIAVLLADFSTHFWPDRGSPPRNR